MNHAITPGTSAGERSWLAAICLSRFFFNLIYMAYAAALPTLTRAWDMTATEAVFVQTCFFVGFALSLFFTSRFSGHIGAKRIFLTFCWLAAVAALLFALYARSYSQALWLFALVGFSQGAPISRRSCWSRKNCRVSGADGGAVGFWPACPRLRGLD